MGVTQQTNPPPAGPAVTGTVRLPNGSLTSLDRSVLERFAELVISKALALMASCGCVRPVGRGVDVTLKRILNDGSEQSGPNSTSSGVTNDQGQYIGHLPVNTHEDTPGGRYLVSVGVGPDTTRAFVFATNGEAVDIDFASEAAVQLILAEVRSSQDTNQPIPLDAFSSQEIRDLVDAIRNLPGLVPGTTPAAVNLNAVGLAASDPGIQAMLAAAAGVLTPTPTFTRLPRPTATRTPIIPTFTPVTPSPTPIGNTRTPTPSFTNTIPATMTPSVTHVVTPTLTPTGGASDTPTSTATGAPASPTATATTVISATPTETGVASPTATATGVTSPTATETGPPAATNTPTSTLPPGETPTPTNTVPVLTDTPTATPTTAAVTPSVTPTTGAGQTVKVVIAPGGGSKGNCRGTCSGGSNPGQACGQNIDCPGTGATCVGPKTCVGGAYNGMTCTSAPQCNGCDPNQICTGVGTPLACCTGSKFGTCPVLGSCALVQGGTTIRVPLNGVCLPRSYPPGDVDCSTAAECHTCVGGDNAGKTCGKTANDCPGGTCSGSGTCQLAQMNLVTGAQDANHEMTLDIPRSSVILNPAVVSGIGAVCVGAGGDGTGLIDCDGGHTNLNATLNRDHNTTPKVCLTGTNKGKACTKNSDCPSGTCNNTCVGGTKLGNACTSNADCPASTCGGNSGTANGLPDDPTCTNTAVQPDGSTSFACIEETKQCSGGSKAGTVCTADTDCPGSTCTFCSIGTTQTCAGGTNGGKACSTATDCPGGTCTIIAKHPGVCNSPQQVVQGGTFNPGDMAIALPLGITILSALPPSGIPPADWGPDGLACTGDETAAPAPPVTVLLSTGTNSVNVYDANNAAGTKIAAQIIGQGVSCSNLTAGNVTGVKLGGGFPATDSPAGDIATVFQFVAQ